MRISRLLATGLGLFASPAVMVLVYAAGQIQKSESDPYPLDACIVMNSPLDKPLTVDLSGREVRVCCAMCVDDVRQSPEKWLQAIDDKIKEQQRDIYPLDTCVVDDTKLDDGNRMDIVVRNRLFRVCGHDCQKKIEQEPAKYFEKLNAAVVAKQKADYPLKTCVVTDKPLGDKAVDYVVANLLVRLADADQVGEFNDKPADYLAKIREARKKAGQK